MLTCPRNNQDLLFWAGTTTDFGYGWGGWSAVRCYSLLIYNFQFQPPISLNQWTFLSFFTDQTTNKQFGFRYYLTTTAQITFRQQTVGGTIYQLNPSATIFWGGKDNYYGNCYCYIQYVRMYWDYLADTQDKLINLALMSPDSKSMMLLYFALIILLIGHLYIFNFASDPQTNNNQTFPITSISNTSQSETIGYKGKKII